MGAGSCAEVSADTDAEVSADTERNALLKSLLAPAKR